MPAFYRRTLLDFLSDHEDRIVGRLTSGASDAGFFQQVHAQTAAWQVEVGVLKACAERLVSEFDAATWQVLLEYPIPRRGKRIDAVLVAGTVLIVLEFKCGAREYGRDAIAQVEDYCLDLGDFHKESSRPADRAGRGRHGSRRGLGAGGAGAEWVKPTWLANARDLPSKISAVRPAISAIGREPVDPSRWDESDYTPTPTIIEAAQALYAGQNVARFRAVIPGSRI